MNYVGVRIDDIRHERMKELAKLSGRTIIDEYRLAIDDHISRTSQELLEEDTQLEIFINNRIKKTEDRLAAMLARNGMDTSIILMGLLRMLSNLTGIDKKDIYNQLRKEAAPYFSRPYSEQKE